MFGPWYETDSDCCQYMCKDERKYKMVQAVWLDRTQTDIAAGHHEYCIVAMEINLDDYSDDDILGAIGTYGYTIVSLIENYGDAALDIIAECIMEEEILRDTYVIGDADSFEDAKYKIGLYRTDDALGNVKLYY